MGYAQLMVGYAMRTEQAQFNFPFLVGKVCAIIAGRRDFTKINNLDLDPLLCWGLGGKRNHKEHEVVVSMHSARSVGSPIQPSDFIQDQTLLPNLFLRLVYSQV